MPNHYIGVDRQMIFETDLAIFAHDPPAQVVKNCETKCDNSLIWHSVMWEFYLTIT